MQKRLIITLLFASVMIISACSQEAQSLPTEVSFPTDVPPTETEEIIPTATATPAERSTLPPTWTPTTEVTDTPIPTETEVVATVTPLPAPDTVSTACDTFQANSELSTREFVVGESPVAAWTPVDGAVLYRVFLYDFNSRTLRDDIYTDQTSWTFDPNVFELGQNYIWAVWPLDSIGDQMCFERGLELLPQRQPIDTGGDEDEG